MPRVLVLFYSQSGDVTRAAEALLKPLADSGAEIVWRRIEPQKPYPYPWRRVDRFFDVLPECVVGDAPPIQPLGLAGEKFDLIVLAYQVWFLSPSLPVQGFFASPAASILAGTPVVTLSVSRNMRNVAARRMKKLLAAAGAVHLGEVAATHQGPAAATFISAPRALLTGRRNAVGRVLPAAGLDETAHARLTRLGGALVERMSTAAEQSLWNPEEAAPLNARYWLAEWAGWALFYTAARIIRLLGRLGKPARLLGVLLLCVWMVLATPLFAVLSLLASPLVARYFRRQTGGQAARATTCSPNCCTPPGTPKSLAGSAR